MRYSGTSPELQVDIAELARRRMRSNAYQALKRVECTYCDGVLLLRGRVPSYYVKQLAQVVVARMDGIERIDNQIEVV